MHQCRKFGVNPSNTFRDLTMFGTHRNMNRRTGKKHNASVTICWAKPQQEVHVYQIIHQHLEAYGVWRSFQLYEHIGWFEQCSVSLITIITFQIPFTDNDCFQNSTGHSWYCTSLYRVGQKKWGHSTFSRISSNTFSQISSKLQKIIIPFFAHIKASV